MSKRRPVAFDSSFAADAAFALAALENSDKTSLRAICCEHPSWKDADCAAQLASHIKVYSGMRGPLIACADGMKPVYAGARALPLKTEQDGALEAAQALYNCALECPGELTVVCYGALTNVACAIAAHDDFPKLVREIVIAGGMTLGGNANHCAEYGFALDPHAAKKVLESGARVVLLPFDLARSLTLKPAELKGKPELFKSIIENNAALATRFDCTGVPLHGALAALYCIDDTLFTTDECFLSVETRSGLTRGMTVTDVYSDKQYVHNGFIALSVDAKNAKNTLLELL